MLSHLAEKFDLSRRYPSQIGINPPIIGELTSRLNSSLSDPFGPLHVAVVAPARTIFWRQICWFLEAVIIKGRRLRVALLIMENPYFATGIGIGK